MTTLGERGELATEHGRTAFAVLMAQDLWIVPVMALIPTLAHTQAPAGATPVATPAATSRPHITEQD